MAPEVPNLGSFVQVREAARGARARLGDQHRRAGRRRARPRRRGREATAPVGVRVARPRQGRPRPPQPTLHAQAALRRGRESDAVRQLLAVRPRRARPLGRAAERPDPRRGIPLRDVSVLLRPPGEGELDASRPGSNRRAEALARRGHSAPGSLRGGDGARRRRRVGVGVQPDREVRPRARAPHAGDGQREGRPRRSGSTCTSAWRGRHGRSARGRGTTARYATRRCATWCASSSLTWAVLRRR